MTSVMKDDAKLFKKFMDEPDFQRWMTGVVFDPLTSRQPPPDDTSLEFVLWERGRRHD